MTARLRLGFSLIELLTVIAIIGLLGSLLLATLSRARASADGAICKNNIRQIAISVTMYVADSGMFPLFESTTRGGELWWWDSLVPYNKSKWPRNMVAPRGIYECPGYTRAGGLYGINYGGALSAFGYNASGSSWWWTEGLGLGGRLISIGRTPDLDQVVATRESQVLHPSQMIALADAPFVIDFTIGFTKPLGQSYLRPGNKSDKQNFSNRPDSATSKAWGRVITARHNGLWNIAFCDSHVEARRTKAIWAMDEGWLRFWNNDHEPHLGMVDFRDQ